MEQAPNDRAAAAQAAEAEKTRRHAAQEEADPSAVPRLQEGYVSPAERKAETALDGNPFLGPHADPAEGKA
jgi:hypothetical protein